MNEYFIKIGINRDQYTVVNASDNGYCFYIFICNGILLTWRPQQKPLIPF